MTCLSFLIRIVPQALLIGVAACAPDTTHEERVEASALVADGSATARAYEVLSSGRVGALPATLSELDRAAAAGDGYASFYAGAFRIWAIGSSRSVTDLLALPALVRDGLKHLERGHALLPDDFRVTSFLGLGQLSMGNTFGDQELIAQGLRTFETGLTQLPAYAHYLRGVSLSGTSRDSEQFKMAIEDMRAVMRECAYPVGETPFDYHYPDETEQADLPHVCLNGSVPHVWEGAFMTYGDIMAKAGDVEAARALYQSVKRAPSYADWPYREHVEERLQTVARRSARHSDRNPLNDPALWTAGPLTCVGCHQDSGEPVR